MIFFNINKLFEYKKIARDLDNIDNINIVTNFAKSYTKLYLKQQEIVSKF